MNLRWSVHLASATGRHHLDSGSPSQDAAAARTWPGGFVAVVSDGAGSAQHSGQGARLLVDRLVALIAAHPFDETQAWSDWIVPAVDLARSAIVELAQAQGFETRNFACTMVGCVVHGQQGCFFHLGDGIGLHRGAGQPAVVSAAENGEFADETFFLTQENWREHLRLMPFSEVGADSLIGLMTDGAMPFVLDRHRSDFFAPFIDPVQRHLRTRSPEEGSAALLGVLQDPRTHDITSDDKTLVLAMAA